MKKKEIQLCCQGSLSQKTLRHLAQIQGTFLAQQLSQLPSSEQQCQRAAISSALKSAYPQADAFRHEI